MKRVFFMFALHFLAGLGATATVEFPSDLPKCHFGDTTCLAKLIETYARKYKDGNSAANIVPLDPLFLDKVDVIQGSKSPVNIQLNFKNVSFHGLSTMHVTKVVGFDRDPATSKFELYLKLKRVALIGPYKVRGSVIIVPVRGNGPANLTFDNVECTLKLKPNIGMKDGRQYVLFTAADFTMTTSRLYMNFENLFGPGNRLLSDTTNLFLNENWHEILVELHTVLQNVIGDIASDVVAQVFAKFPYDSLFLH